MKARVPFAVTRTPKLRRALSNRSRSLRPSSTFGSFGRRSVNFGVSPLSRFREPYTDPPIGCAMGPRGSSPRAPSFRIAVLNTPAARGSPGMRRSKIDLEKRIRTIPGTCMKNGRPHDLHLPDAAQACLKKLPRIEGCDFALSTTGKRPVSGFSKAKAALDAAIVKARAEAPAKAKNKPERLAEWCAHDLRRSDVSTLAQFGVDSIVVDKILAHQPAKLRCRERLSAPQFRPRARSRARRMGRTYHRAASAQCRDASAARQNAATSKIHRGSSSRASARTSARALSRI